MNRRNWLLGSILGWFGLHRQEQKPAIQPMSLYWHLELKRVIVVHGVVANCTRLALWSDFGAPSGIFIAPIDHIRLATDKELGDLVQ